MGWLDGDLPSTLNPDKMVCTFCGKTPVVGFTLVVRPEDIGPDMRLGDFDRETLVAVCKEHFPILQEQMEQATRGCEEIEIGTGDFGGEDAGTD